ncbi:MAG: AI-2E family transporter [Gemmatimonadota bacterium]|nr:MAG: AI-2E family transporter [Gemmatimonadota bacterium]
MTPGFGARQAYGVVATTIFVVLLLLFVNKVADLLLLMFVAALFAVYLASVTDFLTLRFGLARGFGLIGALLGSIFVIGAVALLIVPPVITQFSELMNALPRQVNAWELELARLAQEDNLLGRILSPVGDGGEGGAGFIDRVFQQVSEFFNDVVPYIFSGIGVAIHLVSVLIMGIYMALKPSVYREGVIALTPPAYRELARDILADLGHTLRAWLVGLGIAMLVLGSLTWVGLYLLDVPYSLAFGVFTGLAVIVPFFGTIISTLLPALFVISSGGVSKALLVILLGVIVHVFEANVVAPMVFEKQVELPPVLTIISVLVMAKLLGFVGLLVAVPVLATVMVIVRRIFVHRILEGRGFHRIEKDAPAIISLATGDGVLVLPSASEVNIPALLEG